MVAAAGTAVARGAAHPQVLIDVAPTSRLHVFGMSLLERVVRSLVHAGVEPAAVRLRGVEPDGLEAETRARLHEALPVGVPITLEADREPLAARMAALARHGPLIAVEGDAVLDPRLLAHLLAQPESAAVLAGSGEVATAVVRLLEPLPPWAPGGEAESLVTWTRAAVKEAGLATLSTEEVPDYLPKLRRRLPAFAFRVRSARERDRAERQLFTWSYKGSTDFFTAHVYPPLVWPAVRWLAKHRVHPNLVSWLDVFLALGAVPLFAAGAWLPAFAMAWAMSVLDSVDGKLARLTYRSSRWGHVLDHGLDVVHPPLWYLAWAWPLAAGGLRGPILGAAWLLVAAYVADRLVTEAFTRLSPRRVPGGASIHAWQPLDVRARTWISRRNINLPIFTVGVAVGAAELAFGLVVAWQMATLGFHGLRLVQLWREPVHSARAEGTSR